MAVVLGAAVRPDGTASPAFRLRVAHAVSLWRGGEVAAICVAGGQGAHGEAEGIVGCRLAVGMGVPPEALLAETESRNTVENLTFAARMLEGRPMVLVSSRWHLPRARLAAALLGLAVETSGPAGTMSRRRTARAVLREALAVPATVAKALRAR
ncbi:YdcF family protein [Jannaschia formosa]|uniref:YdcF family protein n=1 Tax=Jannaschia formosa TaxID=2259592 RepID=UPI000E1BF60F|nr:YdcF family protein [Jannaschia formosa]TFL19445.1 YdcF family protein [Jannaschia formosa]